MITAGMKHLYNAIKVKNEKEAEFIRHESSVQKMLATLFGGGHPIHNIYREENFMTMMEEMGFNNGKHV